MMFPGDIVQLDPDLTDVKAFALCLMVVTEVTSWGVIGYVQALGTRDHIGSMAFYRAKTGTFVLCGRAKWVEASDEERPLQ